MSKNNDVVEKFGKEAIQFLEKLDTKFSSRIQNLLEEREKPNSPPRRLDFLNETEEVRNGKWLVNNLPQYLHDRRVEITGPVDRKMVINALNSGANVFMADFEDSNSPTWQNCLEGQVNLFDAVRGEIRFENSAGKKYFLKEKTAELFVRPRGLHLVEKNFVNSAGKEIPASLFDFGLFIFLNGKELLERDKLPCFYLPKMESYLEARLWADVFKFSEDELDLGRGKIKATVLVETLPLAFQMDEVLYELREHSAGLNCGRWDYIFSFMKSLSPISLPDRDELTMTRHFTDSYTKLLIDTCHKRGAHAMGGMAAQIPIKNDDLANAKALHKVREDKLREVKNGHDGTWVAHPGLVSIAKEIFDSNMPSANQINKIFNYEVGKEDLLEVPTGNFTEEGFRKNINIGFEYLKNWIQGNGCVQINNLMEDAATAEISRTQIWQWVKGNVVLSNGKKVTEEYFSSILDEEVESNQENNTAKDIFKNLCLSENLDKFLTTECYKHL